MCKLVAPAIDTLLERFSRGFRNPEKPSEELISALNPLFDTMRELAPLKTNNEAKAIWIVVPVGDLSDYGSVEEAAEYGETEEEFRERWQEEYPYENKWYLLTIAENEPGSRYKFRSVAVDNTGIVNADLGNGTRPETWYKEEPQIMLCKLLSEAAKQSMDMIRNGLYNEYVSTNLPYEHRTGVIRRSDAWKIYPEEKEHIWKGMDKDTFLMFKSFLETNDEDKIGRIKNFTANDFFRACTIGYRACGYDLKDLTPSEAYLRYADGRDEGLTGTGYGLNEGPGIDFDSPAEWDIWYNSSRIGGHPWEVIRGGNSTHVELYVMCDKNRLGECDKKKAASGYYFAIAGKHRPEESIKFFVALRKEGLPVHIYNSEEILARYEENDYIGIVPHRVFPKYCENMFPEKYGNVIDFMHLYSDELDLLPYIEWLPEEKAELL